MNGTTIRVTNECKHLGNFISNTNLLNNAVNIIKDMKIRTNILMSEFYMLNSLTRRQLFNSQCLSLYGNAVGELLLYHHVHIML